MSDSEDETGYKRPPVRSRFKKGQSGNPKGRPTGTRNFKTDVRETLARPVQVTEAGRSRSISTQRAGLERLRDKALRGDHRSLDRLLELAERHGEEETAALAERRFSDQEAEILADYAARIREQAIAEIATGALVTPTATAPQTEGVNPSAESILESQQTNES